MAVKQIKGSTVLVTGANRGIGKAIAEGMLERGSARLYAAVRRPESVQGLVEQYEGRVVAVPFDLVDEGLIEAAAETADDVDLLICNAGVLRTSDVFADDVYEALRFELDSNLFGLIRTVRAFAPVLKRNGGGALVQLNSVVSVKCFPDFTTYCASKAAAYAVTQALRTQLGEQGTSVHSVHPGPIATDMGDAAGLTEIAEPPSLVAGAIAAAVESGEFHVWPDTMARQIGEAYDGFAKGIVEADFSEGS